MQWFYAHNGERLGPVTPEQLSTLVANGTVDETTLVWREGMTDWEPWGNLAAANPLPAAAPDAPAPEPASIDATSSEAGGWTLDGFTEPLQSNGFRTSVGGLLSRAWANYKSMFGLALGVMVVVILISFLVGLLPVVSLLGAFLVTPQLNAGAAWIFLKRARGQDVEFSDVFTGFSRCFGKLALVALIQFGVVICVAIPFGIVGAVTGGTMEQMGSSGDMDPAFAVIFALVVFVLFVVGIWLALRFLLTHIVALDMQGSAVDAYRMSWRITAGKFWVLLGVFIVLFLLSIAGMLALLIGLLFVAPLYPALIAQVYHEASEAAAGRPVE